MQYPLELQLLIACSETSEIDLHKTLSIAQQSISWQQVLMLAMHHRMLPLTYSRLKKVFAALSVPEQIQDSFEKQFAYHNKFAMLMTGRLLQLLKQLSVENIAVLPLKGPALAQQLYNNITKSASTDLDILIAADDFVKVQELLFAKGYKMLSPNFTFTKKRFAIFQKWGHHARYFHEQQRLFIEVHWRTFTFPAAFPVSIPESLSKSKPLFVAGCPVNTIPNEEMILYLCCHGACHAWDRLNWLCDIAAILEKKDIQWNRVVDLAKKWQLVYFVVPGIVLASEVFSKPLPKDIHTLVDLKVKKLVERIRQILGFSLPDNNYPFTNYYLKKKAYDWCLRKNLREKWQYFLYHVHAPEDWFSSPFPDFLYPIAPLFTPFLWLQKNFFSKRNK